MAQDQVRIRMHNLRLSPKASAIVLEVQSVWRRKHKPWKFHELFDEVVYGHFGLRSLKPMEILEELKRRRDEEGDPCELCDLLNEAVYGYFAPRLVKLRAAKPRKSVAA